MRSERGYHPISLIFTVSSEVSKILALRKFGQYSLNGMRDILAFCGRGIDRITPIYDTKLLIVSRNMCTKILRDILIVTQVTDCTDGQTDTQISARHAIIYLYKLYNPYLQLYLVQMNKTIILFLVFVKNIYYFFLSLNTEQYTPPQLLLVRFELALVYFYPIWSTIWSRKKVKRRP